MHASNALCSLAYVHTVCVCVCLSTFIYVCVGESVCVHIMCVHVCFMYGVISLCLGRGIFMCL